MEPLKKIARALGNALGLRQKFYEYPDIVGSTEIFRNFFGLGGTWNQTKQLEAYRRSLYVYACVSKIAQKTASIDWQLFKIKNKVGDTQEIHVHEALDLLYRPNPFQTKTEFFEKYVINKKLTGQNFVLKVRENGPGSKVKELWNLRPDYMRILKDPKLMIKGYEFTAGGKPIVFAPEDIILDAYPSPLDEFGGTSPLQASEVRVETEEFATKYQKNFFINNARPDFLLVAENKIGNTQKEEIKEAWEKRHKAGRTQENVGKGAFLEGGLKYQQVSISQREMDFISALKMTRDDILTAFSVPKVIVAITEDVNYANANTGMQIFLAETIRPEINRITEKLNEHLIYPEYGDIYFIQYEDPVPDNEKEQADLQALQIQNGILLINEAREELGLPPLTGGWSLRRPLSEVPVGGLNQNGKSKSIDSFIEVGGMIKDLAYDPAPEHDERIHNEKGRVFRGRSKAHKFIEIKEEVKAGIYAKLLEQQKPKGKVNYKGKYTKGIIPPEIRTSYAEQTNKGIDARGESFKPAIEKFAVEQKHRVLKELDQHKRNQLNADEAANFRAKALNGLFDKAKENKLFADVSFPFINEFVMSAGKEALQQIAPAEEFSATERVTEYIKGRSKELASVANGTTIDKLAATLAEGLDAGEGTSKLADRVNEVYDEFDTYRSELIARTEATAATNKGFIESYDQSGVANAKEWIAVHDDRTREEHRDMDGEIVGLDENFSNGLDYPQEPNCRCVLGPAFLE